MINEYLNKILFILTTNERAEIFPLLINFPNLRLRSIKIFEVTDETTDDQIRNVIFVVHRSGAVIVGILGERIHNLPTRSRESLKLVSFSRVKPDWCSNEHYFGPTRNFMLELESMEKLKQLFT